MYGPFLDMHHWPIKYVAFGFNKEMSTIVEAWILLISITITDILMSSAMHTHYILTCHTPKGGVHTFVACMSHTQN